MEECKPSNLITVCVVINNAVKKEKSATSYMETKVYKPL